MSLDSTLQANITLVEDNSNLKGRVLDLEAEMKVLEKCAIDVEASNKFNKKEVMRLESALGTTEKERDAKIEEKIWIKQKTYNEVYKAHDFEFNHYLLKVLFHCEVQDESIFDINKDVYNGDFILIYDISEAGH